MRNVINVRASPACCVRRQTFAVCRPDPPAEEEAVKATWLNEAGVENMLESNSLGKSELIKKKC